MNLDLNSLDPTQTIGGIILALLFAALGLGPLKAMRNRRTEEEKTKQAEAEVIGNDFRRTDSMTNRYYAYLQRAEKSRDEAWEVTRKTIEESAKNLENAREDVHKARNQAQESIARVEAAARERIEAATRELIEMRDVVTKQTYEIAVLQERERDCLRRTAMLEADNEQINKRLDNMLKGKKWSATESDVQ